MKIHYMTFTPRALAAVCGLALVAGVAAPAHADQWDQRTILTVSNQPLQVREVVLDPGTYVLKMLNTNSARNIVQIYTADERQLVDTIQGMPAYRPRPTGDTQFTYWETPNGTARALRTWFYPGSLIGQSFAYPDRPRELASINEPVPEALNTMPAEPEQPEAAMPGPSAGADEEQPIETAAAAPEPAPALEPAVEPSPAAAPELAAEPQTAADQPASAPAEMPKTASPFPLIGLCGAFSLCLGGLLRLIRSA